MPFYEYECGACGHRLEALQKISDDPLVYCPECNDASLKKLISAAAFRLKGTGWYETDFKGDKKEDKKEDKKSAESGPADKASSDKSGDKPADAKSGDSTTKSKTSGSKDSAPKAGSATSASA